MVDGTTTCFKQIDERLDVVTTQLQIANTKVTGLKQSLDNITLMLARMEKQPTHSLPLLPTPSGATLSSHVNRTLPVRHHQHQLAL